jgi:hypothetical protein
MMAGVGQPGNRAGVPPDESQPPLGPLRHPCDLDLLLFFHRHPRVVVTSERLAAFVGYDVKQVGRSLDTLLGAAVLQRSPNPAHEARLYALQMGSNDGWLAAVLAAASRDEGRRALIQALKARAPSEPNPEATRAHPANNRTGANRDIEETTNA